MAEKGEDNSRYIERGYKNEKHFLNSISEIFEVSIEKVNEFFQELNYDLDEFINTISLYSENLYLSNSEEIY